MRTSWLIKGFTYGLKLRRPTSADSSYPEEYIWVNTATDTAYIFSSGSWVVRTPDYVKDVNTDNPIYVIGETYLGEDEPGIPVVGPPGPSGPVSDGSAGLIATPDDGEVHFTPKASSTGARGTAFFNSDDDYLYVAIGA